MVVAGVIGIALVLSSEAAGTRRVAWRWQLTELSLAWMLVPPVLLIGASVISPIYTSRYVLMCIPAVALLGGMALVALGRVAGPVALALVLLAGLTTQVAQRQPWGHYDNVRALDQVVAAHARAGDVVLYTNPNAESFSAAYSYGLGRLPNIATKQAAGPSGTLAGTSVGLSTLQARLAHAKRVWVVEINHCLSEPQMLSLSAVKQGPVLAGLPLSFVRIWHERGDWLLLYEHGAGSQASGGRSSPPRTCGFSRHAPPAPRRIAPFQAPRRDSLLRPSRAADLVEQRSNLSLGIPAVTAERAYRGELAVFGPSRHGLRVNAEHGSDLCWGQQPGELW